MRSKKRRALTWVLAGLGLAIIAVGLILVLTGPAAGAAWRHGPGYAFGRGYEGQAPAEGGNGQDAAPKLGREFRDGWGPGRMPMRGAGAMFLGPSMGFCLVFAVLGLFVIATAVRWGFRHGGHHAGPAGDEDAVSLLRREFAEGKLAEDEYRSRLAALRDTRRGS
jgi:uncharacterized membrane protein